MKTMMFNNKKILITGGTGSFGKTMLHSFLKYNFNEIEYLVVMKNKKI